MRHEYDPYHVDVTGWIAPDIHADDVRKNWNRLWILSGIRRLPSDRRTERRRLGTLLRDRGTNSAGWQCPKKSSHRQRAASEGLTNRGRTDGRAFPGGGVAVFEHAVVCGPVGRERETPVSRVDARIRANRRCSAVDRDG